MNDTIIYTDTLPQVYEHSPYALDSPLQHYALGPLRTAVWDDYLLHPDMNDCLFVMKIMGPFLLVYASRARRIGSDEYVTLARVTWRDGTPITEPEPRIVDSHQTQV